MVAYRQACTREGAKVKARRCGTRRASGKRDYADMFDRARRYHEALASKKVKSISALARAEGLSGGRLGQVMVLLYLAPDIIEQVEGAAEPLPGVNQHELLRIARIRDQDRQRREFAELLARGGARSVLRCGPSRAS